jgi:hypothetical protein
MYDFVSLGIEFEQKLTGVFSTHTGYTKQEATHLITSTTRRHACSHMLMSETILDKLISEEREDREQIT